MGWRLRWPPAPALRLRLALSFCTLLLLAQFGNGVVVSILGARAARNDLRNEVATAQEVAREVLATRDTQLKLAGSVLAHDFGFREAVAKGGDLPTITSALENHASRIKAEVALWLDADGHARASFPEIPRDKLELISSDMAHTGAREGGLRVLSLDGRLFQVVEVPVKAPLLVGSVLFGFALDRELAATLRRMTNTEVSFAEVGEDRRLLARVSTLDAERAARAARMSDLRTAGELQQFQLGREDYLNGASRIGGLIGSGHPVMLLFSRSLDAAMAPFWDLQRELLAFSMLSLLLAVGAALWLARSIATPLTGLAAVARRLAEGSYVPLPRNDRQDEIGDLSRAFESMRAGIDQREQRIRQLAYVDLLTGLGNRVSLQDTITDAIAAHPERPLAVLLLDLDRFKFINEVMGHSVGDRVLRAVGERLRTLDRFGALGVARLGGDEFALVVPVEEAGATIAIAEHVDQLLRLPIVVDEQEVDACPSIGIAFYPEHGSDDLSLLRCADLAMYHAKDRQGGVAIFDPALARTNSSALSLLSELRRAVEQDELVLNFQPKLDLSERGKIAVEALVRWNHPTRGFVPPMNFIPFAEQTGFIRNITLWVLRSAMTTCAHWHAKGLEIQVAVNLSTRDLVKSELPAEIGGMLSASGCKPEWILLEVTETALADDLDQVLANLHALRALGCDIALDDYGSEYSSLQYLERLPVSELKIDKSFVLNMLHSQSDESIVRYTIDLGHRLGLRVTAEGVDSPEALRHLQSLGCDAAQGFFLSRPVSAASIEAWYSEGGHRRHLAPAAAPRVLPRSATDSMPSPVAALD